MIRDKLLENSFHVMDILRNISKAKDLEALIVFSESDFYAGVLSYYRKEKKLLLQLPKIDSRLSVGFEVKISFTLKETMFSFNTKINDISDNTLSLTPPTVFRSTFQRHYSRYRPSKEEETIVMMSDGSLHDIKDITTSGLAFYSEKLSYQEGDRIRNMQIFLKDSTICLDADVKYIVEADNGNYYYGTEFANNNWFNNHHLFKYIFKRMYPDIRQIFDYPREDIYMLYESSGYFGLMNRDEIKEAFDNMYQNLPIATNYPQITTNPVFIHNSKIYLGASLLRVYNHTYLAQHLASIPESRMFPSSKQAVYLGMCDYMICNPYCNHFMVYFMASNRWHHKMFWSLAQYIGNENDYIFDTLDYFSMNFQEYTSIGNNPYISITLDDNSEFTNYAKNNLPRLLYNAYSYDREHVDLSEIKQIYGLMGLTLDRCIIKVTHNCETIAFAVCESYSLGLNMFNLLDSIKFYFVKKRADLNLAIDSMLKESSYFYDKYKKNKTFLYIKLDSDQKDLININGLTYSALLGRGIGNNQGIIEYKNLLLNMAR